jgi:hypothetical protein
MPAARIAFNKDNTITVRVGRAVEHISREGKTKAQLFDAVKYAALSKGALISDITLTEMFFQQEV